MSLAERRIINIFQSFIEKVFVPQLPKMDISSKNEWSKFATLISNENTNAAELQSYVDALPVSNAKTGGNGYQISQTRPTIDLPSLEINRNKEPFAFPNLQKQTSSDPDFASKTFGGERARHVIMQLKETEEPDKSQSFARKKPTLQQFTKDQVKPTGVTTQALIPMLERMFKLMSDDQAKLQMQPGANSNRMQSNYERSNYLK